MQVLRGGEILKGILHAYCFQSIMDLICLFLLDSSMQNLCSSDVQQEASTDETPLQDEVEEEEDEEQRRTMAALESELLKYLTDD